MKKLITAVLIAIITMSALFISLSLITYKVNSYQFTNNSKTIIFQEMVHFGEDKYFNEVNDDIENYKALGFVYYYEMIKVESDNDKKDMIKNLGLSEDIFKTIALSTKLESQHNYMITDNNDVNADITASKLNESFNKKSHNNETLINANKIVNQVFSKVNFDSNISTIISKNIMKLGLFINKYVNIQDEVITNVIIEERNDNLISIIEASDDDLIYVQYGQLHYEDFKNKMLSLGYEVKNIDSKAVFK